IRAVMMHEAPGRLSPGGFVLRAYGPGKILRRLPAAGPDNRFLVGNVLVDSVQHLLLLCVRPRFDQRTRALEEFQCPPGLGHIPGAVRASDGISLAEVHEALEEARLPREVTA